METLLDYLATVGGNPEWSLSYLIWQQLQSDELPIGSKGVLPEENERGGAVGEDDSG